MRAIQLVVEPFHFISILEVSCVKQMNEHGSLRISGMIDQDMLAFVYRASMLESWVCCKLLDEHKQENIFFHGVVTDLSVRTECQVHMLTIEIKTGSYLLDQIPHMRSFQSPTTYEAMMEQCLASEDGHFIMRKEKVDRPRECSLQYQETNWEFCKRLASEMGSVLLPEYQRAGKLFYIGFFGTEQTLELSDCSYQFRQSFAQDNRRLHIWSEVGVYQIDSREVYELGAFVCFQGRRFVIERIESWLQGEELSHRYSLASLKEEPQRVFDRQPIQGVALDAVVTKVEGVQVQIQLLKDENKMHCGARWFPYSTVYSTPDGTGWYAMPEVGDAVRLVFPSNQEEDAYVASSVHLESGVHRNRPEQKSWKNKQQKEILFTPEQLIMRNNQGLSVTLSDLEGIIISSNQAIIIQSEEGMELNSQSSTISLQAEGRISINQKAAKIVMEDQIEISGGKIRMN